MEKSHLSTQSNLFLCINICVYIYFFMYSHPKNAPASNKNIPKKKIYYVEKSHFSTGCNLFLCIVVHQKNGKPNAKEEDIHPLYTV